MSGQALEKFLLDGELALVVGAGSGLGMHISRSLAALAVESDHLVSSL